jgi:L-amino acid N-acyltransferase YncA
MRLGRQYPFEVDSLIRCATPDDAEMIQRIYEPFVRNTSVSFEESPPDTAEIASRLSAGIARFPWLVAECDGNFAGYCYAGAHRARASYRWSVDTSIYLNEFFRGRGIGTALYLRLIEILRAQGFYNCYAGITMPNPSSVGLHRSIGFTQIGLYEKVGFKDGAWHDVSWWSLSLARHSICVDEPIDFSLFRETELRDALLIH